MKIFKTPIDFQEIKKIVESTISTSHNEIYKDTLKAINEVFKSKLFTNVAELSEADQNSICFYENEKYISDFQKSQAGLIFIPEKSDFTPQK